MFTIKTFDTVYTLTVVITVQSVTVIGENVNSFRNGTLPQPPTNSSTGGKHANSTVYLVGETDTHLLKS